MSLFSRFFGDNKEGERTGAEKADSKQPTEIGINKYTGKPNVVPRSKSRVFGRKTRGGVSDILNAMNKDMSKNIGRSYYPGNPGGNIHYPTFLKGQEINQLPPRNKKEIQLKVSQSVGTSFDGPGTICTRCNKPPIDNCGLCNGVYGSPKI